MPAQITLARIRITFATLLLVTGGALLALETLFGLVAMLGIGLGTFRDVFVVLCLTLSFPIFLISIRSLRLAVWALWIFFIVQWADECSLGVAPHFISPFDWWHGDVLFLAIVLVQIAYIIQPDMMKKFYAVLD